MFEISPLVWSCISGKLGHLWLAQHAFFICTGFLVVGGLVFLLSACFVVADKQKVDDFYDGKSFHKGASNSHRRMR